MKKILLSVAVLALIGVVSFGATRAFFSDTEVSAGNAFVAGSVDIEITGISDDYLDDGITNPQPKPIFTTDNENGFSFELADLKPLDYGAVSYELTNDTNDAYVCVMVEEAGNAENGRIDPEREAGDTTGSLTNTDSGLGELQNFMSFKFNNQSGLLSAIDGQWFDDGQILSGQTGEFEIGYCFGEYNGISCDPYSGTEDVNIAQTDSMFADVSFQAVQMRNNTDFSCDDLNGDDEEELVVTLGDDWSPLDLGQTVTWAAKAKMQETNPASDHEIAVSTDFSNGPATKIEETVWTTGTAEPFTLTYNSVSNEATFSFTNHPDITYTPVPVPGGNQIAVTIQSWDNNTTIVSDLVFSEGVLSTDNLSITGVGKKYLLISGGDLSDGFVLSGNIRFDFTTVNANGENQKVLISVD